MRSKKTAVNAILLLVGLVLSSAFGSSGSHTDLKQAGVVAFAPLHDNTVKAQSIGQPVPFAMPAAPAPPATVPPLPTSVSVLPGDGFSQLASRLNIPGLDAARLCGANPDFAPPHVLAVDEVLVVPAPDAAVMPCELTVKPPAREVERVAPSGDQGAGSEVQPVAASGDARSITSTGYSWGCGASGNTANGEYPHYGGVASHSLPMGSSWTVLDGPLAGQTFTVNDTGPGATFDIFMDSCSAANRYGRITIQIQPA